MNKSSDYHDYAFRESKLVGEFEEMYLNSVITPWHQVEQENWIDVRLTKEMLLDFGRFEGIHDFGCGRGHLRNLITKDSLTNNGNRYGYEVSATASEKAASSFSVLDLTQRTTCAPFHDTGYVLLCISETSHGNRKH